MFEPEDLISSYSREQALADGALVDPGPAAREAGFKLPVALTAAVWEDCVAWSDKDNRRKGTVQDMRGRLWDVLWMTKVAIQRAGRGTDRVRVELLRVPREGRGHRPRKVVLEAVCGPGDQAEPVITIQQPGED
jgi:hypothetical protein